MTRSMAPLTVQEMQVGMQVYVQAPGNKVDPGLIVTEIARIEPQDDGKFKVFWGLRGRNFITLDRDQVNPDTQFFARG